MKLGRDKEEERLWRRDFYDGAKLRRIDLESGASHIGLVLCHTLVECEYLFGPSRKLISRSEDWIQLRRKTILKSENENLVHLEEEEKEEEEEKKEEKKCCVTTQRTAVKQTTPGRCCSHNTE